MKTTKAVIIYSGGMDSFTLLNLLHQQQDIELYPLTLNYGQRHAKEIEFAKQVCSELNLPHKIVDISAIHHIMNNSSLMGSEAIPEGHYADANMQSTVVPNRNMVLLSLAIAYAANIDAEAVYYGAHSGDHAIYPDCRPEFVEKMDAVSRVANYQPIRLETPFLHLDKGQILSRGLTLGLDYSKAWTCYQGLDKACGKCGACVERLEAFSNNQVTDPVAYL